MQKDNQCWSLWISVQLHKGLPYWCVCVCSRLEHLGGLFATNLGKHFILIICEFRWKTGFHFIRLCSTEIDCFDRCITRSVRVWVFDHQISRNILVAHVHSWWEILFTFFFHQLDLDFAQATCVLRGTRWFVSYASEIPRQFAQRLQWFPVERNAVAFQMLQYEWTNEIKSHDWTTFTAHTHTTYFGLSIHSGARNHVCHISALK